MFDIMQGVSINIFIKNASSQAKANSAISHSKSLAKLYRYNLYGKRTDKYNFLYENTLDSITWQELNPQNPFYLFIPQNDDLRAEYDKGWSVKDIFRVSSVGVVTGKDSVLIASNKEKLELQVKGFYGEFDLKFVKDIAYRPFDFMKIYFDTSKVTRPRFEIMQHFLSNFQNFGLILNRSVALNDFKHSFITNNITDLHILETANASAYILPLYAKNIESQANKADSSEWVENFTPEFRSFIDEKYKEHFSPEQILGYIYAVLFHKEYREKYIDFLKIDFPKIPFVESKEKFLEFSTLGSKLISTHLLQSDELDSTIGQSFYKDTNNRNNTIEKISYNEAKQELFVNESLHFRNVSKEVWEYKIGGYQVLDKYLKSHKDEEIDYEYFGRIIKTLDKSLELEKQIAEIKIFDEF